MQSEISSTIRAFIAVPLSPETVARLTPPVETLRAVCQAGGIAPIWSRPEGWHLTLKFLGPVAADRVVLLRDRLPVCAARHGALTIHFTGFGAFPSPKRPRVLWIGVEADEGTAALGTLAREIDEMTAALGYPADTHPFSPHLTVARVTSRPVPELVTWLERPQPGRLATMRVEQVALMRSEAGSGGSIYTPVAVFPLV